MNSGAYHVVIKIANSMKEISLSFSCLETTLATAMVSTVFEQFEQDLSHPIPKMDYGDEIWNQVAREIECLVWVVSTNISS